MTRGEFRSPRRMSVTGPGCRRQAETSHPRTPAPLLLPGVYSLASGLVATVAGNAVSLSFAGTAGIVVWCAVSGVIALAARLSYEAITGRICGQDPSRRVR